MLLGAVIFVVSMFYLAWLPGKNQHKASAKVNWDDDDIRYYSMNIISPRLSAKRGCSACQV